MKKKSINGFGRIGRCITRWLHRMDSIEEIVAINDLMSIEQACLMLMLDSVHGPFSGRVEVKIVSEDEMYLVIDDHEIRYYQIKNPLDLPWAELEIDICIECTGVIKEADDSAESKKLLRTSNHIKAGAKRVFITQPSPAADVTICAEINEGVYQPDKHIIISPGSCTTNCLARMAKPLHDEFGIVSGWADTIHAYTGDQRLHDLPHSNDRRWRAAAENIIVTTTGAAKAIGIVIPELQGKLNGQAFRVPVANGSVVNFTPELAKSASIEDVNACLKAASEGPMKGTLIFTDLPIASTDVIRDPFNSVPCVFDSTATASLPSGSKKPKLVGWYDNEAGFTEGAIKVLDMIEC